MDNSTKSAEKRLFNHSFSLTEHDQDRMQLLATEATQACQVIMLPAA